MAGTSFKIRGIEPPDLRGYGRDTHLMYWGWVRDLALKAKADDIAAGLNKDGKPMTPGVSAKTRKHRKSAMTPSGKGDPSAPPLIPGHHKSRTISLLAARALSTHVDMFWRFDPFTGDSWGVVLAHWARRRPGWDQMGLSPASTRKVQVAALNRWEKWKRQARPMPRTRPAGVPATARPPIPVHVGAQGTDYAVFGIGASSARVFEQGQWTGGMTWPEWMRYFRKSAPAAIPGRPAPKAAPHKTTGTAYNKLLAHIWGQTGAQAGGGAAAKPKPKPKAPQVHRAAMPAATATAAPRPKPKPKPAATPAPAPKPAAAPTLLPHPDYELRTYGAITEEDAAPIRKAIESLPAGVLRKLRAAGVKFAYAEKMADYNATFASETPRGWDPGMTWAHVDAVYHSRAWTVVVCKTHLDQGGNTVLSKREPNAIRHESGHALDYEFGGRITDRREFHDAYRQDVEAIPAEHRGHYAYYLQPGAAGREEAMADVFAQMHGGGASHYDLLGVFPRVRALLEKILAKL